MVTERTCTCGATLNKDTLESTGGFLHHIVSLSAGENYVMALDLRGNVWMWGTRTNVVPGTTQSLPYRMDFSSSFYDADDPVDMDNAAHTYHTPDTNDGDNVVIAAISAGYDHALALDTTGHVWAWGNNGFGQLGNDAATYGASTA